MRNATDVPPLLSQIATDADALVIAGDITDYGTADEARAFAKELGTLEAGKWADLIVLDRSPLQDIKNTQAIHAVYIAGNLVH